MDNASLEHLLILEKAQILCNTGYWQWLPKQECFFGTEALFMLFELSFSADRLVALSDVNDKVYPADSILVQKKWEDLRAGIKLDFFFRIISTTNELKHLHFISESITTKSGEKVTQGCCRDVTQEKETISILKEYGADLEQQLKTFQRAEQVALSGTWQVNLDTHGAWYSDNIYRLHGLTPQTLPAHLNTFTSFIHPDDKDIVTNASELAYKHRVPLHLEYRIIKSGEIRYLRLVSDITKGIEGEEMLTGISQDVTEQKQLELQLRASNESLDIQNKHFRHTEQIAQTGTWQVNLETRVSYYSDNLYRLYGLKPDSVNKGLKNFLQFIYNEDKLKIEEAQRKVFEEQVLPNLNFRIVRQDGKLRYFSQTAKRVQNAEGEAVMIGVVQDITEQHLLGTQLEKLNRDLSIQNEAFTQAEQTAAIGTWRWNLDTNDVFYSDNVYRIYGLKPQSVKPGYENFSKYFHPDDLTMMKEIPAIMHKHAEAVQVDYRIYRADGELRYLKGRNSLHVSDAGERIMIGTTQDVTDEVLLQQKLDDQIRFIKLLTNNLVDQVMVTDTSNIIVEINKATETIQGLNKSDIVGKNFFEAFPHSKMPLIIDNFKRALAGETVYNAGITAPLFRGYIDRYHVPIKDESGKVISVLTIIRDVTKENQLRQQLEHRLGFIESLLDATISRIIALDKDLNYTSWNKQSEKFYRRTKEEVLGKNLLELYPTIKKQPIYEEIKKCLAGEVIYIPPQFSEQEGYHEAHLIPLKDGEGKINGLLWLILDLSYRQEAEKEIAESRNLLQQTAEASPDAITIYDLQLQQPIYVNSRLAEWIEVPVENLISIGVEGRLLLIHPDDRKSLLDFNMSFKHADDGAINTIEYRILNKKRQYLWIHNRSKVFRRDMEGNVIEIISVLQDITQQKQAEKESIESKQFIESIMDATPDFIMVFNLIQNKIDFVSRSAYAGDEQRYNGTLEINYSKILERAHPDDQDALHEYINNFRTAADDEIKSLDYRVVKDNDIIWYRTRAKVFKRDAKGNATHYISIVQDITDQKIRGEELLAMRKKLDITPELSQQEVLFKNRHKELEAAVQESQNILNAIPHYVWTSLPNGMHIFHNAHWIRESGIDPTSNPDAWQATIHPDDLQRTIRLWEKAITSGIEYYNELRVRNAKGDYRWHIARAVPLKDKKGKTKIWVGTSTDIHELKMAEIKLKHSDK